MLMVLLLMNVTVHEAPVRKFCDRIGFPFEQLVYPQLALGEAFGERAAGLRSGWRWQTRRGASPRPVTFLSSDPRECRRTAHRACRHPAPPPNSIRFSTATAIADATNPTGRCRATRKIRRRSCPHSGAHLVDAARQRHRSGRGEAGAGRRRLRVLRVRCRMSWWQRGDPGGPR